MTFPFPSTATQRAQFGAESVYGTLVPALRTLPNLMIIPNTQNTVMSHRGQGRKIASSHTVPKRWTTAPISGTAISFTELAVLASSFATTPPTPGTVGTGGYEYQFRPYFDRPDNPKSWTVEFGDSSQGQQFGYGVVDSFGISIDRNGGTFTPSGSMLGLAKTDPFTLSGNNAVQTITITGTPGGGDTFTLSYGGYTTTALANTAAASAVQTALRALPSIGSGNVTVTGGAGPSTPWVVTGAGALAGLPMLPITADGSGLTGGATIAVAQTTPGGAPDFDSEPMDPSNTTVYVDTTTIGTTALTGAFKVDLTISNRWGISWPILASNPSHGGIVEMIPTINFKLQLGADSVGKAMLTDLLNKTTRFIRIETTGSALGAANKRMRWDLAYQLSGGGDLTDLAGVWTINWTGEPVVNSSIGAMFALDVITNTADIFA